MRMSGVVRTLVAAAVSFTTLTGFPGAALAEDSVPQASSTVRDESLDPSVTLPSKFDMRGNPAYYVSKIKNQEPWGTCWAFGATAAAETSVFADTGKKVDLSERHLAWFAYTPIAEVDDARQAGEGIYKLEGDWGPNSRYAGGNHTHVMTAYASGAGPVLEDA